MPTQTKHRPLFRVNPNIPAELTEHALFVTDIMEQLLYIVSNSDRFNKDEFYGALHNLVNITETILDKGYDEEWVIKSWVWDLCPLLMGARSIMLSTVEDHYEDYIKGDDDAFTFDRLTTMIADYHTDHHFESQFAIMYDRKRPVESIISMADLIYVELNRNKI